MFSEDEYRLDFFTDQGFGRKKCTSCGKFFWTRDPGRKTCGDPPCDPYTFIGAPIFSREHGLDDVKQMKLATLEPDGSISIVATDAAGLSGARRRRSRTRRPI